MEKDERVVKYNTKERKEKYYYYYCTIWMSLSQAFLPGTSVEPAVIPTAQASSFTLQYFPYYV